MKKLYLIVLAIIFLMSLTLISCEPGSTLPPVQYDLNISSTTGGSVTTPDEGTFTYDKGKEVSLLAVPTTGYRFVNWTGDVGTIANVNAASTTITVNGDYSITANFIARYDLDISSTTGGSVTTPDEGTFTYDKGTVVNLVAVPTTGYRFVNWTGDVGTIANVNVASTTITMNGDYTITANFIARYDLTISSTTGGSVTTPGEGTYTYDEGMVVNLVATPSSGYRFVNWTGDVGTIANVNAASTTITMNGDYTITANFALEIWDWYDLDAVRNNLGDSCLLMNDLDSTTAGYIGLADPGANGGKGWQPIGTSGWIYCFTGTFDGQGYEISNLFINRPDENYIGLFGVVDYGGTVENIGVVDINVIGYRNVGGLVGYNADDAVSNSYSTGSVSGYTNIGGLVGFNGAYGSIVTNSHFTGSVTGDYDVGGLVGRNSGTVSNSYSTGSVSGYKYVGGLVGDNLDTVSNSYSTCSVIDVPGSEDVGGLVGDNDGTVSNSHSTGSVGGYKDVGGLVGNNEFGTVSNSYSTGSVIGDYYVGGLVGWNDPSATVSNSYATGSVIGYIDYAGGLAGVNSGTVNKSYATGSVSGYKNVGGLVGFNYDGTVSNSYWDIQTSGQTTSDGGIGRTTADMKNIINFLPGDWDIIAVANPGERNPAYIWNIVNGLTYPFLSWQ